MARRYVYEWTVRGRLAFPLDMLRYDACYPTTDEDVSEIQASLDPQERIAREQKGFNVTLKSQIGPAEEARWRSFGWSVNNQRKTV